MNIHPTAIVAEGATIAPGVEIGPYSIIGPEVKVGPETIVQSHVVIEGNVSIGRKNLIGHGAAIGGPPQDLGFSLERKTRITIGDENVIREYCTIHRGSADGSATVVGNQNMLMAGVHLGHNCEIRNNIIIANNCLLAGHVRVDDSAFLGGGCLFHQHMHIGRLVMAQGGSAFGKDLPPFVLAAERNYVFGLNVIGLRRAGFSARDRDDIKTAFRLIYTSGMNLKQALETANSMELGPLGREFVDFVANAKKRGICPYRRGTDADSNDV